MRSSGRLGGGSGSSAGAALPALKAPGCSTSTAALARATKVGSQYYYSVQDLLTNAKTNAWTAYLYDYKTKGNPAKKKSWDKFTKDMATGSAAR